MMLIHLMLIAFVVSLPCYLSFISFQSKASCVNLVTANRARYLSSGNGIPDFSQEPVEPFR